MQFAMAFKIIGVLLILFSTAMLPSLLISLIAKDGIESAFATGLATMLSEPPELAAGGGDHEHDRARGGGSSLGGRQQVGR